MKNLFNDISQDEKNRILEMHSAKKNIISEQGIQLIPDFGAETLLSGQRPVPKPQPNKPSGAVKVPQPKKVVEGMTINLYNDKNESSQPKTYKISKIINNSSDGVELQLGDKELSLANPTVVFKCSGGMVMDNPIDTGGQVYNKQLENSLSAQFCQQNKQNITVPKADFAMNNQSTDTTTGIA
jgi:hypothetical protein